MTWFALLLLGAGTLPPQALPVNERAILTELFEATGGSQWINGDGWLGPSGTECSWHGVDCAPDDNRAAHVVGLHLEENNLTGELPATLARLPHLHSLWVYGNHTRPLPDEVLARWDTGLLELNAGGSATDVDQIRIDYSTSVVCVDFGAVIRRDGSVTYWKQECRAAKRNERPKTYCHVKEGRIWAFDRLARTAALYAEPPAVRETDMGTWIDVPVTRITVVRGQKRISIESGFNEPPLRHWLLEQAINGVLVHAEWASTSEQASCPTE
jgi:hypothetical protein